LLVLASSTNPPASADGTTVDIAVRPHSEVSGGTVRLSELCDLASIPEAWRNTLELIELGRAPEAGRERLIVQDALRDTIQRQLAARGMQADMVRLHIPQQVVLTRRCTQIQDRDIAEIYRDFILRQVPWKAEDLSIQQLRSSELPCLPAGRVTHEVVASANERFLGNVGVTIHLLVDGRRVSTVRAAGRVELHQQVVGTRRAIKRNEMLVSADLQMLRCNVTDRPDRFVTNIEEALGKRLLSNMSGNQPLTLNQLDTPFVVKRGDWVTIVFQREGLRVSGKGQAKENGKQGDRVKVANIDSNQEIVCRVVDAQTVEASPSIAGSSP
jgi:flagella basal body P-ring formation protein FlgA